MQSLKKKSKKMVVWMMLLSMLFSFVSPLNQSVVFAETTTTITTIAGTGEAQTSGDGSLATDAAIKEPTALAFDGNGNLYIVCPSANLIRKIDPTGDISTFAGTGVAGFSGDDGQASLAKLNNPTGIAIDPAGNVYIADNANHRVRKVNTEGIISTIAGTGANADNGDEGLAIVAALGLPTGIVVYEGVIYVSTGNNKIKKFTEGGNITTIAGIGLATYFGDGGAATAAYLNTPWDMIIDSNGDLFVSDQFNHVVRKINHETGIITKIAGTGGVSGSTGDGGSATNAKLNRPAALAFDQLGNLYIADQNNHKIRIITTDGLINTLAGTGSSDFSGDDGSASAAALSYPCGLAFDSNGNLYVADTYNNRIRKITITQSDPDPDPTPITHTITFDINEGEGIAPDPIDVTEGSSWNLLPGVGDMSKAGLDFGGWTTEANNLATIVNDNEIPTGDLTLYAFWEATPLASWSDEVASAVQGTDYNGGDGTYDIYTAKGLAWLANEVNTGNFSGDHAELEADIDLTGKQWVPIGNYDNSFAAIFEGSGHKITGLEIGTVEDPDNNYTVTGLFGYADSATIRNLSVAGNIYSTYSGSCIGLAVGESLDTSIYNCSTSGKIYGGANAYIGGIIGYLQRSFLYNSFSTADVAGTTVTSAGGAIGTNSNSEIGNIYCTGKVMVESTQDGIGAVVGAGVGIYSNENILWNSEALQMINGEAVALIDKHGDGGDGVTDESFPKTIVQLKAQTVLDGLNAFVATDISSGNSFDTKLALWEEDIDTINQEFPILDYASLTSPVLNSSATLTSTTLTIEGTTIYVPYSTSYTAFRSAVTIPSGAEVKLMYTNWAAYATDRTKFVEVADQEGTSILDSGYNVVSISEDDSSIIKYDIVISTVGLTSGSLGVAGNTKITGLTTGNKYKITVGGSTKYVKADGTLSNTEADVANLTGTEITGLSNGTSYKVETYTPTPVYAQAFTENQVTVTRTESAVIELTLTGATTYDSFKFDLRLSTDPVPTRAELMALDENNTFEGPDGMNTFQAKLPKDDENLTANTNYKLYIIAKSGANYQEEVTIISFTTKQSAPAFGNGKVTVTDITDTSAAINVDWEENDGEFLIMILPSAYTDEWIHQHMIIWSMEQGLEGAYVTSGGKVSANITTDAGGDPLVANTSYKAIILGFEDVVDHKGNSQATATIIPFTTLSEAPIATNLANGSLGVSGNNKITGLNAGAKYQVVVGNAIKYVKSDGTLSSNEADVANLTGTEITGLSNGTTYKVELYSISDTQSVTGAKTALDNSEFTYSNGDSANNVTQNITLPLLGENGTTITWVEKTDGGNNVVLNGGSFTVTRPSSATGDRIVTLTATITKNDISETKDIIITVKALPTQNNDSSSDRTTTPPTNQDPIVVIVNGKSENAGTETKTTEEGKSVVTVAVNNQVIESKIDDAIKNNPTGTDNLIQVPVADTKSDVVKVELTGDIIKKLEENTFDLSIKRGDVEYLIPAEEFTISNVAKDLGVAEGSLKDIKIEVKITKLDEAVVAKYNEVAKANGAELVFPPVEFEIIAKTTKTDGTKADVEISKFSNYVERVMEIPAGVDVSKITTGIVFNPDGTYSHVPTEVFQKDGKWYARLNSLTNSNYSVVWNPIEVKSVENHWSKDAVNDMASRLVVFDPENFDPNQAITRGDFAEYIVRALGIYRVGSTHENKFSDLKTSGDRTLAILIANEYGIITGYPDGTFRPEAKITREEAMAMYQRAMKVTKLVGTDQNRYQTYTDYKQVGSWATDYVKAVLSAHVFNGTTATTIAPKANLTYAEAAQAIKNLLVESKLINK